MWSSLSQRKQALESVLDIWSGYESKKVSLESFITQCEDKSDKLLKGLENPTSTVAINRELLKLKVISILCTFEDILVICQYHYT